MIAIRSSLALLLSSLLVALSVSPRAALAEGETDEAFAANLRLTPGVNLGNALEAPREGEWGVTLKEVYFEAIAKAGFKAVRVPIRWSAHAAGEAPYTIDAAFWERIDWVVKQALARDLAIVINVHHYGEIDQEPERHRPRLVALWKQIAERYRDQPDGVFFELLNEPHDKLTDEVWQTMFPQVLKTVRESNPRRFVIIGPGHWNNVDHLKNLSLPEDDRRLIATFHYYSPFEFTHQGAEWVPDSAQWKGQTWTATDEQLAALRKDLQKAADWGLQHKRPVYLGEFGAYRIAPLESRAAWTKAVAREAGKLGLSWCYWEFCAGFGIYDPQTGQWREPLRDALLRRAAALGQGDHSIKLTVDDRPRSYRVHVPPQYDPAKPTPVVLVFHGKTMNGKRMASLCGLDAKADEAGFIAVYPNGTGPRDLFLRFNAGEETLPPREGFADDVKFTERLLDDLAARVNLDPKRVYATGMSNGATMCYRLAAELPKRFAAIAPVAGTMPLATGRPEKPMPVLHFHGTADAIVPYTGPDDTVSGTVKYFSVEDTARLWAGVNRCALQPETVELPDASDDDMSVRRMTFAPGEGKAEVIVYAVQGGGHTWPGSESLLNKTLGRSTRDISANDLIWEFFQRHSLP